MTRASFVFDRETGELVDRDTFYARQPAPARSALPRPMLISDRMEPAEHPCTGQVIDSKSRFERITREHGCITIGNDPQRLKPPTRKGPDRKAIRNSLRRSFAQHGLS